MQRVERAHYSPPWANTSIIGVAGSSGSGKTSLAIEIISSMNLPWVVILSMVRSIRLTRNIVRSPLQDSFYKPLTPAESKQAFRNEYDFDAPSAIDFDVLVEKLRDLKQGRRAEIPVYSFSRHQREEHTTSIYSPHVLILEGIFALYDQRVLDLLDLKIFAEADADVCLSRRIVRDVQDRGRDIEGVIKQWLAFVKPNFQKYVEPQRNNADIIVPRGIENRVAINMVTSHIQRTLVQKSREHRDELLRLGKQVEEEPLDTRAMVLPENSQIVGIHTILQSPLTDRVDFCFYFDRIAALLIEKAGDYQTFHSNDVDTPAGNRYHGLQAEGNVSAVVILRGGSCLETGLKRVIPDCQTGRLLIQSSHRTGEPELHYRKLPGNLSSQDMVLLLDSQMASGGAALMAVRVLIDHGVAEKNIVFVAYSAGKMGVNRLLAVYPDMKVVVSRVVVDYEERWLESRYFGS